VVGDQLASNAGGASVTPGATTLSIRHGLRGAPNSITITPSKGSAPEVSVDAETIHLAWASPPGHIYVWWAAAL
jgi:hypothetical protein